MKYIISGSNGFIGKELVNILIENEQQYIALTRHGNASVTDNKYFDEAEVDENDVFIHLANMSYVPDSWSNSIQFHEVNVMGTIKCLEFCKKNKLKFIYVSSYMYGKPNYLPVDEKHEVKVNNPYALTKKMAEEAIQFYAENFDIPYVIIRPFNLYGPGQRSEFLIPTIIDQVVSKSTKEIVLRDLAPKRDYVFISDAVQAIFLCAQNPKNNIVNISSGLSYSVKELVDVIQKIYKTDKPVNSLNEVRSNEIDDCYGSFDFIKSQYGWEPTTSLKEGLKKCIE